MNSTDLRLTLGHHGKPNLCIGIHLLPDHQNLDIVSTMTYLNNHRQDDLSKVQHLLTKVPILPWYFVFGTRDPLQPETTPNAHVHSAPACGLNPRTRGQAHIQSFGGLHKKVSWTGNTSHQMSYSRGQPKPTNWVSWWELNGVMRFFQILAPILKRRRKNHLWSFSHVYLESAKFLGNFQ